MQKNIVMGVNAALAAQTANKPKTAPLSDALSVDVSTLQEEVAHLKDENTKFAVAVEEMQAQNKELRDKIDALLAEKAATTKEKKKRTSKKKK